MDKLRNLNQIFKRKLLRLGKALSKTFCEFCECSSVNGVRYITEQGLHWSERIWWIIAIAVSLWMCGTLIHNSWVDWRENLTVKVEEESFISAIPFPTVTICPLNRVTKDKFDLAKMKRSATSDADLSRLYALADVCPLVSYKNEVMDTKFKKNYTDESIYDMLEEMAPKLDYVLKDCRWQSKPFECSKYFSPVFLTEGICFSFNALNSHDFYTNEIATRLMTIRNNPDVSNWDWDIGYKDDSIETEYPLRVYDPGPFAGLEFSFIVHEQDLTHECDVKEAEFRVHLSVPGELSNSMKSAGGRPPVSISSNAVLMMQPELTTTSEALRSYSPNERGCFYNSERRLNLFRTYSKENCDAECFSNYFKLRIGCAPIDMPRHKDTKICGKLYRKYYRNIYKTLSSVDHEYRKKCNCLDSCTSLEYFGKMDSVQFNMSAVNEAKGFHANYSEIKMSKLAIFFKDRELKSVKRMATSTYADFLAICGGLLGLFLGVTALSMIEIVYYLSLRLFWNVRNLNAPNSVAPTELDMAGPSNVASDSTQQQNPCQNVRLSHAIKVVAIEYGDNGCVHGVQYITEKGLYWIERLWWFVGIIVSFGVCGYLMRNIWVEWSLNPVTTVRGKDAVLLSIPHPTITLCPRMESWKHTFDISSALKNTNSLSDIETGQLKALSHVCPLVADRFEYTDEHMNESIFNTLENLSMDINESIFACHFRRQRDCSKIVFPALTDEGLCFTVNNLNSHEIYTDAMAPGMMIAKNNPNVSGWSLDSGYTNGMNATGYPRSNVISDKIGTYIAFKLNKNDDNQCTDVDQAIKVIISVPGDPLQMSHNYYRVPISKITLLRANAKITTSSEGIRRYTPHQRQCFYSSERQLKFFKNYTENNCRAECLANFTKMECGCVKFSMPRDKETKICGNPNIMCYRLAEKTLRISDTAQYFRSKCNCMPTCNSIEYTVTVSRGETDQTSFKKQGWTKTMFLFELNTNVQVVNRQDTYTWTSFLSIFGGFLGLFLGMSALSVVEVIYYSTLRLFWRFRRLKSEMNLNSPTIDIITVETLDDLSLD